MLLSWFPPLAFTLFIYSTLSSVPKLWGMIFSKFSRSAIMGTIEILLAGLFLSAIAYLVFRVKTGRTAKILWLFGVGFVYAGFILSIEIVVEQVHLVEYGVLAGLYLSPFRKLLKDQTAFYAAWLVTFSAGIVDELIQYYSPVRVGTVPDICLNGYTAALALLLLAKVFCRDGGNPPVSFRNVRIVCGIFALNLLLLGTFVSIVTDYGFLHKDPKIGAFYSRFPVEELKRKDRLGKHIAAIKDLYPVKMHTYLKDESAMDKFSAEVLVHLFRRDRYVEKGDLWVAYKENLILENYFTESIKGSGFGWPPERVKQVEAELKVPADKFYESPVARDDVIVAFGPVTLWGGISFLVGALTTIILGGGRKMFPKLAPALSGD